MGAARNRRRAKRSALSLSFPKLAERFGNAARRRSKLRFPLGNLRASAVARSRGGALRQHGDTRCALRGTGRVGGDFRRETEFRLHSAFPKRFANFGNESQKEVPVIHARTSLIRSRALTLTSF